MHGTACDLHEEYAGEKEDKRFLLRPIQYKFRGRTKIFFAPNTI